MSSTTFFPPCFSKHWYICVIQYKSQLVSMTSYVGQLGIISGLLSVGNIAGLLKKQVVLMQ